MIIKTIFRIWVFIFFALCQSIFAGSPSRFEPSENFLFEKGEAAMPEGKVFVGHSYRLLMIWQNEQKAKPMIIRMVIGGERFTGFSGRYVIPLTAKKYKF
jgi:hypothetical protein